MVYYNHLLIKQAQAIKCGQTAAARNLRQISGDKHRKMIAIKQQNKAEINGQFEMTLKMNNTTMHMRLMHDAKY